MSSAELGGANFSDSSNLTYCDFRQAKNLNLYAVKLTRHWENAFYDDDETLKALGLPPDHNDKLARRQAKEKELQQKQNTEQTTPKLSPAKQ